MRSARGFGTGALVVLQVAVLYLPFEEFLLKWVPVGATGYALLRVGFEALLYAAVGALVLARRVRGLRLRATPLDLPLALFVLLAASSIAFSGGELLPGLVNLRVLLRYVAVFYLAAYLELNAPERRRVCKLVLLAAALQGAIGLVQHLQGGAGAFWLPRADHLDVGGVTREFASLAGGLERGAVLGTTDHSVAFALFLLVAGTLAWAAWLNGAVRGRNGPWLLGGVLLLAFAGVLFSYVRSCLFALALTTGMLAWLERRGEPLRRLLPAALVLVPLGAGLLLTTGLGEGAAFAREKETEVGPLASLQALFTSEYLQTAESSRLWVLRDVGGEIVHSAGWLGFGPDEQHVKRELLASGGVALHRLIAYRAFEDVYWVALLAYYGFLGLAVFLVLLGSLAPIALRARRTAEDPWERAAADTLLVLLVVLVPLSFLAPTLDFRTFAFYFWLLGGMAAARATAAPRDERAPVRAARPLVLRAEGGA